MSNTGEISISIASPEDHMAWEALFLEYGVFYKTSFPPEVLAGVWEWIKKEVHPLHCFIAKIDGTMVGFAHVRDQPDTFTAASSWFLDDLYTDPSARGRGVATALLAAITEHASQNGGGTLRWITGADNVVAQRLYDTLATKTSWVMYEDEIAGPR
ncbi:MAG: GNAT family N-acetyltransferase [Pontimonas sp.]